jgi:hypothetical protein
MYVTLRRIRLTIVSVEKHSVLNFSRVCLYPELFNMQYTCAVLYCHLWSLRIRHVFVRIS